MQVGLPRALLYYKYGVFWETFLKNIGVKVQVSPPTKKPILEEGLNFAESEICMPVKIFYGHVSYLVNNNVNAIFIPRMVAVEKPAYTCPKFLGLPDMIKACFPQVQVLTETFNRKSGTRDFYKGFISIAREFGASTLKAFQAIINAEKVQSEFLKYLHNGFTYSEALKKISGGKTKNSALEPSEKKLTIGIAAHSYNIYDSYFSLDLLKKLESLGVNYLTPDNVPSNIWSKFSNRLPKFLFWTYERELVGSAFYWIEKGIVDGLIYVMSFACGPDSIVQYILEDECRKYGVPMLTIVLDEHSAEAGLLTRVEAFTDMLFRRKK